MTFHPMVYRIFANKFVSKEMKEVFDEKNYIQKILDVELALAEAEGELGLIPVWAVPLIREQTKTEKINLDEVAKVREKAGHYLTSILKVLEENCAKGSGQFIHYGVTTQDIIDTAMILMIREALVLIKQDVKAILKASMELAEKYKNTVMAGRTHGVHALPITFGFKVAIWASELARHLQRLRDLEPRFLVGNLTGAVGTFASFGPKGPEVQRIALSKIGLNSPIICWHAARDNVEEFVNWIAMVGATLAKIANEVRVLMKTEIGEVEEPIKAGTIGSSTMPHKRNPSLSEETMALAKHLRSSVGMMLEAMETEHERDVSTFRCEFLILPESCMLLSAGLRNVREILEGLKVYPERMLKNVNLTQGLIISEALMFSVGERIGKQRAHEVVYELAMKAVQEGRPFCDVFKENPEVGRMYSSGQLDSMMDPSSYTGLAQQIVDSVLTELHKEFS